MIASKFYALNNSPTLDMDVPTDLIALVPLFPLLSPLFPDGTVTLQVFEVRYLSVVRHCHRHGLPFGVVGLTQGKEVRSPQAPAVEFYKVGTFAHIEKLEHLQAGLIRLECRGHQRFSCHNVVQQADGLWRADLRPLPRDAHCPIPIDLQSCADRLKDLMERHQYPSSGLFDDGGWVANRWAEVLPISLATKQQLMALDNPLLRLELINDMMHSMRAS